VFIVGALMAMAPQLFFTATHGYDSRLRQTFILHPHNIVHITPFIGDPNVTTPGIVWFSLKQTLRFLYLADSGEQYNYDQPPLPTWAEMLAVLGLLMLLPKCIKREPNALFLVATMVLTIITSAFMVEANFSPYLVLFALFIPLALALGWDVFWRLIKLRNVVLLSVVTVAIGCVWGEWNWSFYSYTMSPERSRIGQPQNYLLNLPVKQKAVKYIFNVSNFGLCEGETYYKLIYPNAAQVKAPSETTPEEALSLMNQQGCPCLVVEDLPEVERLTSAIEGAGKKVELYRYPKMPVGYLVVDGTK